MTASTRPWRRASAGGTTAVGAATPPPPARAARGRPPRVAPPRRRSRPRRPPTGVRALAGPPQPPDSAVGRVAAIGAVPRVRAAVLALRLDDVVAAGRRREENHPDMRVT